jgi:hypothetical protein
MKNTILLSITLLAIAACGQEEPAQPEPGDPVVVEEVVTDESAETMETVEEAEATVVEESAAEPEGDEQTIMLAQADTPAVAQEWQFQEGKNYIQLRAIDQRVGSKQTGKYPFRTGSGDVESSARFARPYVLHGRNSGPQRRHRGRGRF